MSKLRSVSTSFWSDPFIEDLTPDQKLLFLYLITNEKTNMLGIYEASIKKISFETGIRKETVQKGLKAFEKVGKVKYIKNFVILVNYMKHQNFNTNMKKSAIDAYNSLPSELKNNEIKVEKSKPLEGFESLLNHFGMVRKIEVEDEEEIEDEFKENKNDIFLGADISNFSDELKKLLKEFIQYRKDIKKPLKSKKSIEILVQKMKAHGFENSKYVIELAISNSWQGIVWEKISDKPKPKKSQNFWENDDLSLPPDEFSFGNK